VENEDHSHVFCAICGSTLQIERTLYDDRFGYHGEFGLKYCSTCGHRSLEMNFSESEISQLYTSYYPRSYLPLESFCPRKEVHGFLSWFNGHKRSAYTWVPKNVTILDIGCGFGETLAYHRLRGCDVYGVEADENIRRVAELYNFNVHIGLFDSENYKPDFFDYVTLDQVIEHVKDPMETLTGIARVLKPGGLAILSTPNSNGWGARLFARRWINWHAPYHLQHFSKMSMKMAAEKAGLRIECVKTLTSSEWLHYQWIQLFIFPSMGEPSQFWSPKAKRVFWQKVVRAILGVIHHVRFNHIITRIFDGFGVGDNYLFFLRKL
jgi:2-polyprenyl-3-methyl-5-hydroxy-6-metoxy-1,4-benzoquinol methylase